MDDPLYQAQMLVHVYLLNVHKTDKQYGEVHHNTNIWKLAQAAEERVPNSAASCHPTARLIHDETRQNDLSEPIVSHYQGANGSHVAPWSDYFENPQ